MNNKNKPKFAVLLAAFNGAQFIERQINSIISQKNVEVSIFVSIDMSIDKTEAIIIRMMKKHHNIYLISKNRKFGNACKNFLFLIKNVNFDSYDFISFSDQDDEWFPSKIKYMCKVLADNPSINLVICDAIITDQYLSPTSETVLSRLSRNFMLDSEYKAHNLGCAIAVSKSIMPLLLPIRKISGDALDYGHDTLLNEICCAINSRIVIKKPLQYYRRHPDAATIPDHTVVGSISSTNIKLSDHLNRSSELSLEYLKRLHALHLLIYRFMDYYSHEKPMLDNAQIFSISNLVSLYFALSGLFVDSTAFS